MAEPKKLITKESRLHNARQLIESISEPANNAYYAFIGNHLEYANTADIPQPNDSVFTTHIDVYRNMIFGKRISSNDIKIMIDRNDYTSNTVYSMYDDTVGEANIDFFDSNYYAVVNADSYYHVFKVLDNNNGSPSTVQPEFSEVDPQDEFYQTSDGYVWKYMYTVDDATVRKFATSEFFPVVANAQVAAAAKDGIINVIKVENTGRGYDNYCNGTFRIEDLKVDGNSYIYSLNSSINANTTSKFYNECYVYIAAGTGAGQYAKILDYVVNSSVKAIHIDSPFSIPPLADSVYEISPGVKITGDGSETTKAEARAIVNSVGNSIQRIEMLNLGENYKYAIASVLADDVVGVSNTAIIRPIYSPPGGHGFDAASELGATKICISTKLSNTDIGIPVTNEYRTIGILRDPQFANVTITYTDSNGSFIADEAVYTVKGVRISDNSTISTSDAVLSANADFENQLSAGEYIYLKTDSGYSLSVVNSVVNSSYVTLTQNSNYSCTATSVYKTNISPSTGVNSAQGHITSVATGSFIASNVSGIFKTGDKIIGSKSGAFATVDTIYRSGDAKGFDTFIQMNKYTVSTVDGVFIPDESVFQSETGLLSDQYANAYFHSVVDDGVNLNYYLTNQIGIFNSGQHFIGVDSSATANVVNKYSPELEFGSGKVMYIENIDSIIRSNTATEIIKFIFEF